MLNLWGYARPILPIVANQPNIAYGMPSPPVQVNFDLIDTGNSGNIDIVRSSGSGVKIKKSTIRSGFVDQKDIYKSHDQLYTQDVYQEGVLLLLL